MSDPGNPTRPQTPENTGEAGLRQAGEDLRVAAREARTAASEAATTVSSEAVAAAETLKREGAELLGTARHRAEGLAQEGVQAGAAQAKGIARAIHRAAEELERESPTLARTIHDAAGTVDGMARALRDRSPGEMLRGAEDFARRQPLVFFSAAALAGFAIARFARASATHHHPPHGARHDLHAGGTSAIGGMAGTTTRAPGWVADETGTPRPATLASASLGGSAAYRPRGGTENG